MQTDSGTKIYMRRPPVTASEYLFLSPLLKLVFDAELTGYLVLYKHRGGTNSELGLKALILDVQYLLFVLYMSDKIGHDRIASVFTPIMVLSSASLAIALGLLFLIYKNFYIWNRLMNLCLLTAIISGFVFCLSFKTHLRTYEFNTTALVCLLTGSVALFFYAVLKNCMRKLYYNLVSVLYLENDFRLNPHFNLIKVLTNFVSPAHLVRHSEAELQRKRSDGAEQALRVKSPTVRSLSPTSLDEFDLINWTGPAP